MSPAPLQFESTYMARNTSIKLVGIPRVTKNIDTLKLRTVAEAKKVIKAEGERALQRAKELTPVRTGALRDSGKLVEKRSASGTEFQISFGGDGVDYALPVHERTDVRHRSGRSKFLETAVKETSRGLTRRLADRLSRVLRRVIK